MKTSVALLLLISLLPIRAAGAEKPNDVAGFKVNIPEGLYLYQPWINEATFSPLFIIRDGKLLNPYELYGAKERGSDCERTEEEKKVLDSFMRENVIGQTFNVYVGTEKVGSLNKVVFENCNECEARVMFSSMSGAGDYAGERFTRYVKSTDFQMQYSSLKAVATPSSHTKGIKNRPFTLTEQDKAKVIESVRREFLSAAMERLNAALQPPHYSSVKASKEGRSRLDSLQAIDLNGNGRKDFIGIYTFYVIYTEESETSDEPWGNISEEIVFVMFDNGRAETVSFNVGRTPAFSLSGVIDIDGDGIQELIIQIPVDDYENDFIVDGVPYEPNPYDDGREFIIFRHGKSGWKEIYRSGKICGDI